ncbi:MAG: peptide chain release factor N(5)-glutamine methyltransferase [Erysipelotrichaceae bacterium]|nr:peptide chain release factor N(5)-glutamine methyltransferase [Erysipelotrichaceae bacterium]
MTIRELILQSESKLEALEKDVNVAKVLFYHLANMNPQQLYLNFDNEVERSVLEKFHNLLEEYIAGKPIQYIKGYETFFGRDFKVNSDVLIPRYETEELVEQILYRIDDYFDDYPSIELCDVGTGSGAIAITLALEEALLHVVASDISQKAVAVAQENADALDANVEFFVGDMLEPLLARNHKVDVFVSNPPYIPQNQEIESLVKDNEPNIALFGGDDGLYFYRKIFAGVKPLLNDRALLAFEMGFDQREIMERAVKEYFDDEFEIIKDINGKDRMLFIYYNIEKNETRNAAVVHSGPAIGRCPGHGRVSFQRRGCPISVLQEL